MLAVVVTVPALAVMDTAIVSVVVTGIVTVIAGIVIKMVEVMEGMVLFVGVLMVR